MYTGLIRYISFIKGMKDAKTVVKGNKTGKITGSSDDMQEKLIYKCGLKRRQVWDANSMSWYTKVYYVDGTPYNPVLFHDGKLEKNPKFK
jgi:hypothetical protein